MPDISEAVPMSGTENGHRAKTQPLGGVDPDDLGIYIAIPKEGVPYWVWLKFKAEVMAYVANKLKDLGT